MSLNLVKTLLILNAKKAAKGKNPKMKGWSDLARKKAALKRKAKAKKVESTIQPKLQKGAVKATVKALKLVKKVKDNSKASQIHLDAATKHSMAASRTFGQLKNKTPLTPSQAAHKEITQQHRRIALRYAIRSGKGITPGQAWWFAKDPKAAKLLKKALSLYKPGSSRD